MEYININEFINTQLGNIQAHIFVMKVKDLIPIYYVAVRGRDNIPGAVQRVLSKRRISDIKRFVLEGNMFFNTFILNWVDQNYPLTINEKVLSIPKVPVGAQVIDGQHRLEGLKLALEEKAEIGEQKAIILLTQNLTTPEAAKIFLNINTEQKPVPDSLVYDLFGEIKNPNYFLVRATDISKRLHEDYLSPYYQCVKMAGAAQGVGKVDLSAMVNAIKLFTTDQGIFSEYNLTDFESQYKVICNFFNVIRYFYNKEGYWLKACNPFMTNAGCHAGIEFLCKEIISKCVERKSFEEAVIKELIPLDKTDLLFKDELKNKQGKEQRNIIYQYLRSVLLKDVPNQYEYKF